jgi:hypothetical protein
MKSSCQLKGIKTECAMAINKNEKAEQHHIDKKGESFGGGVQFLSLFNIKFFQRGQEKNNQKKLFV